MVSASFAATIASVLAGLACAQSCDWTLGSASPSSCSSAPIAQCLSAGGSLSTASGGTTVTVDCPFGAQTLGLGAGSSASSYACAGCVPNPGYQAGDLSMSVDDTSGALTAVVTSYDSSGAASQCTYSGQITDGSCGGYSSSTAAPSGGSASSTVPTAAPIPASHRGNVQVTLDLSGVSQDQLNNANLQAALAAASQKLLGLTNGEVSVSIVSVAAGPTVTVQLTTGADYSLDNLVTLVRAGVNELAANSAAAQAFEAQIASAAGVASVSATATNYVVTDSTSSDAASVGSGMFAVLAAGLVTAVITASL